MHKTLAKAALLLTLASTSAPATETCDYASLKGVELTFRETYSGGETYGYQLWRKQADLGARGLPYKPYVGRKGKVAVGIIEGKGGFGKFKRVVLDNCETVYAYVSDGETPDGAFSSLDLELGKALIGKQIWIDQAQVARPSTLATLNRDVTYPLSQLEPVTVIDLYLPSIGHAYGRGPFFLKVKKSSGEMGFLAFNSMYFHRTYPIAPDTPARIADAIQQQEVVLGMTAEQVKLSWGKPEDVNRTVGSWGVHEQWVYGRKFVYLENGKVTSFQD